MQNDAPVYHASARKILRRKERTNLPYVIGALQHDSENTFSSKIYFMALALMRRLGLDIYTSRDVIGHENTYKEKGKKLN